MVAGATTVHGCERVCLRLRATEGLDGEVTVYHGRRRQRRQSDSREAHTVKESDALTRLKYPQLPGADIAQLVKGVQWPTAPVQCLDLDARNASRACTVTLCAVFSSVCDSVCIGRVKEPVVQERERERERRRATGPCEHKLIDHINPKKEIGYELLHKLLNSLIPPLPGLSESQSAVEKTIM